MRLWDEDTGGTAFCLDNGGHGSFQQEQRAVLQAGRKEFRKSAQTETSLTQTHKPDPNATTSDGASLTLRPSGSKRTRTVGLDIEFEFLIKD